MPGEREKLPVYIDSTDGCAQLSERHQKSTERAAHIEVVLASNFGISAQQFCDISAALVAGNRKFKHHWKTRI